MQVNGLTDEWQRGKTAGGGWQKLQYIHDQFRLDNNK